MPPKKATSAGKASSGFANVGAIRVKLLEAAVTAQDKLAALIGQEAAVKGEMGALMHTLLAKDVLTGGQHASKRETLGELIALQGKVEAANVAMLFARSRYQLARTFCLHNGDSGKYDAYKALADADEAKFKASFPSFFAAAGEAAVLETVEAREEALADEAAEAGMEADAGAADAALAAAVAAAAAQVGVKRRRPHADADDDDDV